MGWLALALLNPTIQAASPPPAASSPTGAVVFNRDVRPILSDNCFHCHGFDAGFRKANLRLDTPEGATEIRDGRQAIKPGDLQGSELWRRVSSTDPSYRMPPLDSGKSLKPAQIETLRKWISEGGAYQKHWAFESPTRPNPPTVTRTNWPRNDIDQFILATLEHHSLQPNEDAPKETLLRRVTLDLTGLPPTLEELETFLADKESGAYERAVDRLLASPRYGEHMARYWLDVARYGDTHGLHLDNERNMWAYRDWVVEAFNNNLPFDEFTTWQLAGDLLENPTRQQLIASGFNRCNVSTSEGGAIDEEFQVRYAVDRVETTSAAWLGLTMGCAVCHDHKLDPITQKEFYQVFSIFNNIDEKAMDGNAPLPPPILRLTSPEQEKQLASYDADIVRLTTKVRQIADRVQYTDPADNTNAPMTDPQETVWLEDDFPQGVEISTNQGNAPHQWISAPEATPHSGQRALQRTGSGLHQTYFTKWSAPAAVKPGDKLFAYVYLDSATPPRSIMLQVHVGGWDHRAVWGDPELIPYGAKDTPEKFVAGELPEKGKWIRLEVEAASIGLKSAAKIDGLAFTQYDGKMLWDKVGVVSVNDPAKDPSMSLAAWQKAEKALADKSSAPTEIKELLKKEPSKLSADEKTTLKRHFLEEVYIAEGETNLAPLRAEIKTVRENKGKLEKAIPGTMISKETEKPRDSWVLIRGEYDKHGEPVGPGVPSILPPLPQTDKTNRLAFAKWLTDPKHPLTSRVTANRFWQQFFGTGLVKTAEDFGTKGDWPSHPELLDWLATELMRTGWDVKQMVKLIVTSSTYRQNSKVSPELVARDPENRLLARGPRHRLDAEVLRDYALSLSGLLNLQMGGRGVRTYQPPGIWEAVGYTTSDTAKYTQDKGDALYRRSLYLFWKRTAPPPSMTTFDAPSREQCRSRRERTNTPLQALVTMNDPQYVEAARHFAARIWKQAASDADRLRLGYRLTTSRLPCEQEADVLADTLAATRSHYEKHPEAAKQLIAVGESPVPTDIPAPELAAYTVVANLMLNLDEAVTKN